MPLSDLLHQSLWNYRFKAMDAPKPPQIGNASYFSECERIPAGQENAGACLPGDGSGGGEGGEQGTSEQPQQEQQQTPAESSEQQAPKTPQEAWEERASARGEGLWIIDHDLGITDEQTRDLTEKSTALLNISPDAGPEAIGIAAADLLQGWEGFFNREIEKLKSAGAHDRELTPLMRTLEKARNKFAKAAEKAKQSSAKYQQAIQARNLLEQQEPPEPEYPEEPELDELDEPDYPDEPEEPEDPGEAPNRDDTYTHTQDLAGNVIALPEPLPAYDTYTHTQDLAGNVIALPEPLPAYDTDEDYAQAVAEWQTERAQYEADLIAHQEAFAKWEEDTTNLKSSWEEENSRLEKEWEGAHGKWEKDTEKLTSGYEKAQAKWSDLLDKASAKVDELEQKTNDLIGEIDNIADEFYADEASGILNDTAEEIKLRIEEDESLDPEPEEEEEPEPAEPPAKLPQWRKDLPWYLTKGNGPHKYGCLMAVIPEALRRQITAWTMENIPDAHLGVGGREDSPHVTILYGFTDSSKATVDAIKELLSVWGPFVIRFGPPSLFRGNDDGDVLKLDITGLELFRLNGALKAGFPNHDKYPEYKPHLTLAYLDPNFSASYVGTKPPFLGERCLIDCVEWSGVDGHREIIHLTEVRDKALPAVKDRIPGGLASGKPDSDFDPDALAAGIKVELEHTDDPAVAKEIAKDHLQEDPNYYRKLREMEQQDKTMSAINPLAGGALVPPPKQGKLIDLRRKYRKGWVTIGGTTCSEGQHCGGSPVFIGRAGEITKGPKKLVGKKPSELKKPSAPQMTQKAPPGGEAPKGKPKAPAMRSDNVAAMLRGLGAAKPVEDYKMPEGFAEELMKIAGGDAPPGPMAEFTDTPGEVGPDDVTGPPAELIHDAGTAQKPSPPVLDPAVEAPGKPTELDPDPEARAKIAASLSDGDLADAVRLGDANTNRNETYLMTMDDGTQGVFKPFTGEYENLREGMIDTGTYWTREIAASKIADILGFTDLVPTTVARSKDGEEGSIQQFVGGAKTATKTGKDKRFDGDEDAARAAVFDYLMGASDRHTGNWMLSDSGRLVLIDNGLTLPYAYVDHHYNALQFWDNAVKKNYNVPDLSSVAGKWGEIESALRELDLEENAIKLTKQRFDAVVSASGNSFADLPALSGEFTTQTVKDMVEFAEEMRKMRGVAV